MTSGTTCPSAISRRQRLPLLDTGEKEDEKCRSYEFLNLFGPHLEQGATAENASMARHHVDAKAGQSTGEGLTRWLGREEA